MEPIHLPTPLASRDRAVEHIVTGGGLAASGAATFALGTLLPATPLFYMGFVVGGIALAGAGLVQAGRAVAHLSRFGTPGSTTGLFAATGLGASMATFALTHALLIVSDVETGLRILNDASALGTVGFGTVLALLTLRALVAWAWAGPEPPPADS